MSDDPKLDLGVLRLNIYLYEDEWDLLREYSRNFDMSMSEVARGLIHTLNSKQQTIFPEAGDRRGKRRRRHQVFKA